VASGKTDGTENFLRNYDDPSSAEERTNEMWQQQRPPASADSSIISPYWSASSSPQQHYLVPSVVQRTSPYMPMYQMPIMQHPTKRFDSAMETDILSLPRPLSPGLPQLDRSSSAHLLDSASGSDQQQQQQTLGGFNGYRFRPMNYNLRGYSATGNGRIAGFLPAMSPRKRQILFRQCFFNPISCF
jgi:hypothetical protein